MTGLGRCSIAILLVLMCVSCSSNAVPIPSEQARELWENPTLLPVFITDVTRSSDDFATFSQDVCAWINEYYVWEIGSNGNETSEAIQRSTRVLVNGQPITNLRFQIGAAAYIRFDESGEHELGSHNFATSVCFDTSNFSPGYYITTLQFASMSGVGYAYTWAFWLKE